MINILAANTILYCDSWQETVQFYQRLNLPVLEQSDWFVEFEINPGARLSVADTARASIASSSGAGITITFEVSDIHKAYAEVVQAGISSAGINQHGWGAEVFYIFDPEGNRIEFWCSVNDHA